MLCASRRRHTILVSDWSSDLCFFVSSRRRHTRLVSDWSSDVCSSDLLSNASLHGAKWLTGGTVGPEGSVFSFLTMGILAVAIHLLFPAKKTEQIGRASCRERV